MTLDDLRAKVREMLAIFDDRIEKAREQLLASARLIHNAESKFGEWHPAVVAAWKQWAPLQRLYNGLVDKDKAEKNKAAEEARGKGSTIREVHQEIHGLAGLDPISATWGTDPDTEHSGALGQTGIGLALAITIVIGVLGLASLTVWLARIVENIKATDSLKTKADDLLVYFQAMDKAGWTKEEAQKALTEIYGQTTPVFGPLPPWVPIAAVATLVGVGLFFVLRRRKPGARAKRSR
jgi:hypothetical protein